MDKDLLDKHIKIFLAKNKKVPEKFRNEFQERIDNMEYYECYNRDRILTIQKALINFLFFLVLLNVPVFLFGQDKVLKNEVTPDEFIFYYTTKIECKIKKGSKYEYGAGTGFFFDFDTTAFNRKPFLITNKHVVENAIEGKFDIAIMNSNGLPDTTTFSIVLNDFNKRWIYHPDSSIDLCIMPMAPILQEIRTEHGKELFYVPIELNLIPNEEQWNQLSAMETIKMVGYPIGLYDFYNNFPVVRTGLTASPPYLNFQGREVFVIDMACFPGSSGSPIMIYDIGHSSDKRGMLSYGSRVYFLGILYAGPKINVNGEIQPRNIPLNVQTRIPINIGYVIKSNVLLDYFEVIPGL